MSASAALVGIGLLSANRSSMSGNSCSCSARARAQSSARTASHISAISRGLTFATTEITPRLPTEYSGNAVKSSPDRSVTRSPQWRTISVPRRMLADASLIATMLSRSASRATVSACMSHAVRPGTL